jgi:hypothetical protein
VDLNRLVKLLDDGGFTYKVENHEISIDGGTPAAAHINRMAFENGITLKRIGERKATLEESFFEMVAE